MANWTKLDKNRYINTENGAFIAIFNWNGKRTPLLYLSQAEYSRGGTDYLTCKNVKDAKAQGDKIELLGLIPTL
ncbi:hypothetical protein L1267_17935 [Pseudoalteromonas sp. OFAV1]|uniref:hypothetical protein n=1 Tax=Pseudoalteromonas sp. OFAV1 TaxID=2908892 RepID=UPI001F45761F|nr:hypothetical protein [Pseudoalteromonas sp. OFAV1]MCF2902253.1 hypothetical protein [Pseudoalteromonas sp. OFAV1]